MPQLRHTTRNVEPNGAASTLVVVPRRHIVCDDAEPFYACGIFRLGALGRSEHDDAYTGVVAALSHDPSRRLYELRVRQHRRQEDDSASLAQVEARNVWV